MGLASAVQGGIIAVNGSILVLSLAGVGLQNVQVAKAMKRSRQRQGERRRKWRPSGMTQHPRRGLLNVPHASLTVTRRRMPGSDRCRTKGAVVYRHAPSLLPSLHPPILCLPLRETGPFPSSRRCVADLNVIAEEKKKGGLVCRDWRPWSVRPRQAVLGGCALELLCSPFSPATRWCVTRLHLLTCNATLPRLDNKHLSCRLPPNTRKRWTRTRAGNQASLLLSTRVTVNFCSFCAFKITKT